MHESRPDESIPVESTPAGSTFAPKSMPHDPEPATGLADWQSLPLRARPLFVLGTAIWLAILGAGIGGFLGRLARRFDLPLLDAWGIFGGAAAGLLAGLLLGVWWGSKSYRYTTWKHDEHGLAVRTGKLWRSETLVPTTRVQHLDIKRGPWQRRRHLSTLIVHTAGTRHSAMTVPHLDADDAERLRDRLARQVDHDDES